jgi:hypothetical protein
MLAPASALRAGERVLWQGVPERGLRLARRDLLLIPSSLVWVGFIIFWNIGVARGHAPLPFRLFGLGFLLVGVFFLIGRFVVDALLRARTTYTLTDRRALIVRTGAMSRHSSVDLRAVADLHLSSEPGGLGTLRFGPGAPLLGFGTSGMSFWVPALDPTPQFAMLRDAARVFELALAARD